MLGRLLPRDGRFFDFFNEHAALIVAAGREMAALMAQFSEFERHAAAIDRTKRKATGLPTARWRRPPDVHHAVDREDIHRLSTAMDDIRPAARLRTVDLYDVRGPTPEAKRLADICLACAESERGRSMLANMDNAQRILRCAPRSTA
jgi:hypothetical protein